MSSRAEVRFNITPMIDVVFLLIIFFILVSTFASAENVLMELPQPDESQAEKIKLTDRVVINCQVATGAQNTTGALYSVGPHPPESLTDISRRIAAARGANPDLKVVIRADKRLPYRLVREAMEVVAANEIEHMSLVAHVGEEGGL